MRRYAYNVKCKSDVIVYEDTIETVPANHIAMNDAENAAYVKYIAALTAARNEKVSPRDYPRPPLYGVPVTTAAEPTFEVPTPAKRKSSAAPELAALDVVELEDLLNGADDR